MVKALLKKADTIDHQLQILMAQARKCERDDLGRKQMIPEDEEQKQEWERNCEWVRLFVRSSLSSVDEETLNTMLADVRDLKSMCRTLHLMEGAAETVASAIDTFSSQSSADPRDHDELNARLGHGRSRSRSRAPTPSRARRPSPGKSPGQQAVYTNLCNYFGSKLHILAARFMLVSPFGMAWLSTIDDVTLISTLEHFTSLSLRRFGQAVQHSCWCAFASSHNERLKLVSDHQIVQCACCVECQTIAPCCKCY